MTAHTAVAKSDQDSDGARGGDTWDATQTLDYIYTNQTTRDAQSILNEAGIDISVRNAGLIVARGLGGDDVILASAGADYLYGNAGVNQIILDGTASNVALPVNPGEDRVYYDTRSGKQYVANFQAGVDSFYLAKNVIDAFDPTHASTKSWNVVDATSSGVFGEYTLPQAYDPNITFIHGLSYGPLLSSLYGAGPYTNAQYAQVDFLSDKIDYAAGSAMYAVGSALWGVPFVGPIIAIPFYVLGGVFQTSELLSWNWDPLSLIGADALVPDYENALATALGDDQDDFKGSQTFLGSSTHKNATYSLDVGGGALNSFTTSYVYVLETQSSLKTTNTTLASSVSTGADNKNFLDFFHTVSDGFIPAIELNPGVDNFADVTKLSFNFNSFTDYVARNSNDYGVYAYFAVHSNNETFVYLINSRDNIITNDEAYLVSEIGGILDATDFKIYDNGDDIYNQYVDHPEFGTPTPNDPDPVVVRYVPTLDSVDAKISTSPDVWDPLDQGERTSASALRVDVSIAPVAGTTVTINVYDNLEVDTSTNTPVLVGSGSITSGNSTVTIDDGRTLGQTIMRTDYDVNLSSPIDQTSSTPPSSITIDENSGSGDLKALSDDNSFEYFDTKVSYLSVVRIFGTKSGVR